MTKIARHHKSRGEDAAVDVSILYIDDSICIYLNVRVYAWKVYNVTYKQMYVCK